MKIIELLKLRFGEQSLQYCDIMIKDVAFSKRMNKLIHDENKKIENIQAMIISHLFWPSFRNDTLKLPPPIFELFQSFQTEYKNIKKDRKIEWLPYLGTVDLEIEFNEEIRSFTVNPFQATVLFYFQEKSEWNLSDLAEIMEVSYENVKRKITFWIGHGIIQNVGNDVYRLLEQGEQQISNQHLDDDLGESSLTDAQDGKDAMWALCFNFINAFLTNQGAMGLDKIHFVLTSLMRDEYRATAVELRSFLNKKVKEDVLEFEDNLYHSKD